MAMDHTMAITRKGPKGSSSEDIKPVKRGRGRPPKNSYVTTGPQPADLTHIRAPAKQERTFYSSDEDEDIAVDSDEDLAQMDEDDFDWRPTGTGFSAKKAQLMGNKRGPSKRGRKPKIYNPVEVYVPKSEIKEEEPEDVDEPIERITDESQDIVYQTMEAEQAQLVETEGMDMINILISSEITQFYLFF